MKAVMYERDIYNMECKNALIDFIRDLYVLSEKRNKRLNERQLSRILNEETKIIRRKVGDPLIEIDIKETLNDFCRCLLHYFKNGYEENDGFNDFLVKFMGGNPRFGLKVGNDNSDLVSVRHEEFYIWLFFLEKSTNSDRKKYLEEAIQKGKTLEYHFGKRFKGIMLFEKEKTHRVFIPYDETIKGEFLRVDSKQEPKTNLNDMVLNNCASAIVILDVEGQFSRQMEILLKKIDKMCKQQNIQLPILDTKCIPHNSTLAFSELDLYYLEHFMSKLTVKTRDHFKVALKNIERESITGFDDLYAKLSYELEKNQVIHTSIKKALSGALLSLRRIADELFDQEMKTPITSEELLVPGKITVLDISPLNDEDKRYVAIYLLALLDQQKRKSGNPTRTVLVFDEAHKLFPQVPPRSEKDYVERIINFVADIVHRGRKRKYSVIISTQSPKDVAKEISKLCDTDIIFEVSGQNSWIREQVYSKVARQKIQTLRGVGVAHVVCKGTTMADYAPKVRIPNMQELVYENFDPIKNENDCNNEPVLNKVGKIIHRQNSSLVTLIGEGTIQGYIPSKYAHLVHPPQLLMAKPENNGKKNKVFCEVTRVESKPWSIRMEEKQAQEFVTYVDLKLIRETDEDYDGLPRNQNLDCYGLFFPSDEEITTCYDFPKVGLPLGLTIVSETSKQTPTFYFPYNPNNYQKNENEWLIDHSMFIVGNQGRGKTNLLFYISILFACSNPEVIGKTIINHTLVRLLDT